MSIIVVGGVASSIATFTVLEGMAESELGFPGWGATPST